MKLIVGLGNPGDKYVNTRHNAGFYVLDKYAEGKNLTWKMDKKSNAEIARDGDIILAKPQTFMNKSGESVTKLSNYFEVKPEDITVVHDDVDFDEGVIKKHFGRGSAGHKGVQNIIDMLGTNEFGRLRIGVGRPENPNIETDDWVLMNYDLDTLNIDENILL